MCVTVYMHARPTCEMVIKLFMRIHERFYACDQVVFKMNYEIFWQRMFRNGERERERAGMRAMYA